MRSANFVQETTTSIAGVSGNGAVTMTAIAGSPRASNAYGVQATTTRYVIEKKSTGSLESGIGVMAANVLTRTRPQVTWDGVTFLDASSGVVAPLAFEAAPTAGDVIVRIGPTAESAPAPWQGRQSLVGGDGVFDSYPLSTHQQGANNGGPRSFAADTEYYSVYLLPVAGLVTGALFSVSVSGGSVKRAIYDVNTSGLPGNKILTLNTISVATTGIKTDTASSTWVPAGGIWLPAGFYIIGQIFSAATSLLGYQSGSVATPFGRKNGYGYSDTLYKAGSYASGLPDTPNLTGGSMGDPGTLGNGFAWLGLRVTP
jgi:hypothetical protein